VRHLPRKKLLRSAEFYLKRKTAEVGAIPVADRAEAARDMWKKAGRTVAFAEIKGKLKRMARGRQRCMYCEDSVGVAIDHRWPLARYPHKAFRWKNYLLACTSCNSNEKRDRFPIGWASGKPLLLDPTRDDPLDHLVFEPATGRFQARKGSPKGTMTINVLGLNARIDLVNGRFDELTTVQALVVAYAGKRRAGSTASADKLELAIRRRSFSSVLVHVLRIVDDGYGLLFFTADFLTALAAHPEIRNWA
jgi:uncharacterized protein (TIGR02646 family)